MADNLLRDKIPTFEKQAGHSGEVSLSNWSALTSGPGIKTWLEVVSIILVAVVVVGGTEYLLEYYQVPQYRFPKPSEIGQSLVRDFPVLWPHVVVTLKELLVGYALGASIGMAMAAVITQSPFVEKIVTPYILVLVTTPAVVLVPQLMLWLGFGSEPRIIVVALAVGPMVMINAATGFRRVDLAKVALARSFGANIFQIYWKIRIPMALPMVIVGLMVGSIFGLLTVVAAELIGGKDGLGNRVTYYSSYAQMPRVFACIVIISFIGISLYVLFYLIGKKWASWEA